MKKIFTKEVVIGIIAIISFFIFYTGVNYLKGVNLFRPTNHYYVRLSNVSELQSSGPVYVGGFKVGVVNAINYEYNKEDAGFLVEIGLDKQMKVQTGSYAELKTSMMNGAYIDLVLNNYVSTYCNPGDTIVGVSNPSLMEHVEANLLPQVENILPRLDSILYGVQTIVNHPSLTQSLDQIYLTSANLNRISSQLNKMLGNDISEIATDFKKVSSDLTEISENLKQVDINETLTIVNEAIANIDKVTQQLNNPDNNLGLLLNDKELYLQLETTAKNAADLLEDIKTNPKRYVHFSVF